MVTKIPKMIKGIGLFLAVSTIGYANIVRLNMRCSEDSLDVNQAIERVEWAAKCGYITADDKNDSLYTGSEGRRRDRSMYPLFATVDLASMWKAPVDRNAPCHIPSGYQVMAFCTASCYTPDQVLLFPEGFVSIKKARDLFLPEVVTLDEKSTLSDIRLKVTNVASVSYHIIAAT